MSEFEVCSSPEPEVAELREAEPDERLGPQPRRGRRREKKGPLLIVKIDFKRILQSRKWVEAKRAKGKPPSPIPELATAHKRKLPPAARKLAAAGVCRPASIGDAGDVFTFSEKPQRKVRDEKEKAKRAVLRTISKMTAENQIIRQRLISLSQSTDGDSPRGPH
ncbi:uncharacterized protein ACB058_012040 [Synchiropus picturatus]